MMGLWRHGARTRERRAALRDPAPRWGMTLLALAALVVSFDVVVLADMATYKLPEPWPTARFLALQMAAVGALVALVAMLPDRARRVRVLLLSGLLVWLYPVAVPLLGPAGASEQLVGVAILLAAAAIPLAPRKILAALMPAATVVEQIAVISGGLALLVAGLLYWQEGSSYPADRARAQAPAPLDLAAARERPDIYHLVFDGMGRPDVLEARYGVETGAHLARLRELGFVVDPAVGLANYTQTYLSIASMLNLAYLDQLPGPDKPATSSRLPAHRLLETAAAVERLREAGYRYELIGNGIAFSGAQLQADACHCEYPWLGFFESKALARSPLQALPWYGWQYAAHRWHVRATLERIKAYEPEGPPRLVIAHVMLPHAPFAFDAQGGPAIPHRPASIDEGPLWRGTAGEYRSGYAAQARFAMDRVVDLAGSLVAVSKRHGRQAVIVIHGDHGPRRPFDGDGPFDQAETFPVLLAVRWSDGRRIDPGPRSLVNVYRALLREYFGAPLPDLPDRTFTSSFARPYQFREVALAAGIR